MTASEQNAATGQGLGPARAQAKGSRMMSVVHGKDERSLHLSPILQQIKDDGPALIDGEVVKEAGAAPKPARSAVPTDTKTLTPPVASPLLADRHVKMLVGFCAALTLGLCASLYFSWHQQQRLANVEYMLKVLVTAPR